MLGEDGDWLGPPAPAPWGPEGRGAWGLPPCVPTWQRTRELRNQLPSSPLPAQPQAQDRHFTLHPHHFQSPVQSWDMAGRQRLPLHPCHKPWTAQLEAPWQTFSTPSKCWGEMPTSLGSGQLHKCEINSGTGLVLREGNRKQFTRRGGGEEE